MKGILFLSLPGSSEYKTYKEGRDKFMFEFVPFSSGSHPPLKLKMEEGVPDIDLRRILRKQPEIHSYTKSEYEGLVVKTIDEIKENKWGKVVLSRPYVLGGFRKDPLELFEKLCGSYPAACVYLFYHPEAGCWLGATPELLLEGGNGKLRTMSLAGTRALGMEDSFEAKEEEEQGLVSSYIAGVLNSAEGVSGVHMDKREKLPAGNVVHFVNHISADYSDSFTKDSLLKKLHPTPAVGGYPKAEALRFIAENEKHDRSYYSGYFGLQVNDKFDYFVNLRCMQIFDSSAVLYAGGGITKDSDPVDEWRETEMKLQTLLGLIK